MEASVITDYNRLILLQTIRNASVITDFDKSVCFYRL